MNIQPVLTPELVKRSPAERFGRLVQNGRRQDYARNQEISIGPTD